MSLQKSKSKETSLPTFITEEIEQSKQLSLCQKIKLIITNITVEPILILYVLPSVMAMRATQNLSLEKACRVNLQLANKICDSLTIRNSSGYNQSDEIAVQKLVSTMNIWKSVIQSLIPAVLLLFFGSWSDRHQRRKPFIILPMIGELSTFLGFLLSTYFFYEIPMELNAVFESVPPSLTGGFFSMFMAVYSYVSGISTVESRTLRIGAVNLLSNISVTIGMALSGILYKELGFYGIFSLTVIMYAIGILYGITRIKDIVKPCEGSSSTVNLIRDFFDVRHIKETFKVAFRDGPKNRKTRICTIMVLVMVFIGPVQGEINVMYLFVRYKFGWNEIDYSLYLAFHFIIHISGTLFSLMFFTKFLKVDDAVLGIISCSCKIAVSFLYAFAPQSYFFYIGALVEGLNSTSFIALRSIISKLVPGDELGKINSLFGVSQSLMPLVYGPMYNIVYKMTINVLPGAFFLLGGFLTIPALVIFCWLYKQHINDKKEETRIQTEKLLNS